MKVWRIEVRPTRAEWDAVARSQLAELRELGFAAVRAVRSARLFFVQCAATEAEVRRLCAELLADPVTERYACRPAEQTAAAEPSVPAVEVHLRPGVMDPVAASTEAAIRDSGISVRAVRTARRYEFEGALDAAALRAIARRVLANDCIEEVYVLGFGGPAPPTGMPVARPYRFELRHRRISDLDDDGLARLSREGHLFLSLEEMRCIQASYRQRGREPTDLELETLAQTWSEHCVHKTLKSAMVYRGAPMPSAGPRGINAAGRNAEHRTPNAEHRTLNTDNVEVRYDNLLAETIVAATEKLARDWCLSVFRDNAGIIAFDDDCGIAFKVETHNHPSAIEPYGGAATGVGGCIRDVIGCGLAARPVANTDVFCFAPPDWPADRLPKGVLHPRTVMRGVVAGVRDYGNRMGIPTVNGAIHFDPRYLGNPLVFCGCVGLVPRNRIAKGARPHDAVVLVGGRTGRDGIHGATFSSAELSDAHADEFGHAVQIGNAITEKKLLDCILQARDHAAGCLFSSITDCGAGGLSSAVGEMAAALGAVVDLEKVPLKYEGLRYDEIWISEAQERMVLAVPPGNLEAIMAIFAAEDVEATVIGEFTSDGRLVVRYESNVVGELDLEFLHHGWPRATRLAEWRPAETSKRRNVKKSKPLAATVRVKPGSEREVYAGQSDEERELIERLGSLNTASREWVIRQYDHEVQGGSVVKPLVGPGSGPSDAAVIRPRLDSDRGIAIGCGLCPQLSDEDPYWMAVAAVDEAIRNVVCVGGDPARTAILDNFCWGRTDDPRQLGALVRACQGAHDAAMAFGTPFISGKDSLNNEFAMDEADARMLRAHLAQRAASETGCPTSSDMGDAVVQHNRLSIPGTLLVSAVSMIDDVSRCVTMDLKAAPGAGTLEAFWIGWEQASSHSTEILGVMADLHRFVHECIRRGFFVAAHDFCEDDLLTAVAEMCVAGDCGAMVSGDTLDELRGRLVASGYVVQVADTADFAEWLAEERDRCFGRHGQSWHFTAVGRVDPRDLVRIRRENGPGVEIPLERLAQAWRSPFDW